jgi:hypothetical protein
VDSILQDVLTCYSFIKQIFEFQVLEIVQ